MLHLPYWRMKGLSFSVKSHEIGSRFVDTSMLATDAVGLPKSLGVKPQTMRLTFASPDMTGRYLEARLPSRAVIPANEISDFGESIFYHAFIGEIISLVYAPAYVEDGMLWDALLERPLSSWNDDKPVASAADIRPPNLQIRFIPTLCPLCGWNLQGQKDAVVLTCKNCDSAWTCNETALKEVPFAVLASSQDGIVYLPFWRMKPRTEDVALNTYADLIRIANLPKALLPDFDSVPIYFWSPAFRVNPALFLRWSRQMTIHQPRGKMVTTFSGAAFCSATLDSREAVEGMKITLAHLVADKHRIYPGLETMGLAADEILLVYHPFLVSPRELIHETMHLTLDRTALNYGSYL